MDLEVFRPMLYGLIMWAVTIYAFRKGGWEERLAAVNSVIGSYLSALVANPNGTFQHFEGPMAIVDTSMLVALMLIALQSNKFWPLWLAAIQGVSVLGHLAPLIPDMQPATSYNAVALWSYPAWIILAFAIRKHDRQRAAAARSMV